MSRRFGQAMGGWIVGLPLTSGPIAVFLAIEHGPAFAQSAAAGSLEGTVGPASYTATYARLAVRYRWPTCLAGAIVAFVGWSLSVAVLSLPMPMLALVAVVALLVALRLIGQPALSTSAGTVPKWDLPARMIVATALVLLITGVASAIGPDATGIAATFPLVASVLAVFAHSDDGPFAAQSVVRGLLLGLFGFVGFFVVVSLLVARMDLVSVFALALAVNLLIHGASLAVLQRTSR